MSEVLNVEEIFGKNVFTLGKMEERLPKEAFLEVKSVMDQGGELSMATANIVAKAMKEWAVENGATHYSHWFQPLNGITAEKLAWVMDLIGKGPEEKGIVWVARRVPDGYICSHANQSRITTFPLNDPENCLYAKDVISFARKMGYFDGNDVIYPYSPAHIGITVGKVEHLLNAHTALVRSNPPLKREDGYKLMRRDVEVSGCSATGEMKNGYSVIHCTEEIKIGDCVHLTSDSELRNRLLSKKPVVDIILSLKINGGEKPSCFFQSGYYCMDYTFDFTVEKAEKLPLTAEEIKKQFSKNGDNEFNIRFGNIVTHDAFLAKSQLNAMRRKICELAFDYILGQYEREKASEICLKIEPQIKIEGDYAEVRDASFLPILQNFVKNVVYSPDDFTEEGCKNFAEEGKKQGFTVFIRPPVYVSQKLLPFFEKICVFFDGILCNNFGLIGLAKERNLLAVAGPNLNIMNTKNPYIDVCNDYFLSPELNRSEIRKFENGILYTYGKLPLLYLSACLRHLMGITCNTCRGKIELCDEKGSYPLRTIKVQGKNCTHILKNGIVTDIGNEYRYKKFYFDFTESTLAKAKEILRSYYAGEEYCPQDSNKLHLKRGVK